MNNPGMNIPGGVPPPTVHLPETKKKKCCKVKTANGTGPESTSKRGRKKKPVDDKKNKKKFGKKGVTVTSQAREIVYNVIKHFKKEAQDKCNSHPFENWLKRSVAATGLSKSTLQRIIKEVEKPAVKPDSVDAKMNIKEESSVAAGSVATPHHHHPMPPMDETVKMEQYEQSLIKHFTTNFVHHNMHHHHPMATAAHHPDLLLQPIHHAPMPPPPQPTNPVLTHPHNPHTHLHL